MSLYANFAVSQRNSNVPTGVVMGRRSAQNSTDSDWYTRLTKHESEDSRRTRRSAANTFGTATVSHPPFQVTPQNVSVPTPVTDESVLRGVEENSEQMKVDRLANERMLLLTRRYAKGQDSQETTIRLELLTARILRLVPRVTEKHVETLAEVTRSIEQSAISRAERALKRAARREQRKAIG